MNRRIAIRNLALVLGGASILPSCIQGQQHEKAAITLKNIDISVDQEGFLADVTETMIPATDVPGARDLQLHLFVLTMVDDCFSRKDQDSFMKGLDQLRGKAKDRYGKHFGECTTGQREGLLNEIEQHRGKDDIAFFYDVTKRETILGYTNSEYFMTKQIRYELIPGRYDANFPVSKLKAGKKYA